MLKSVFMVISLIGHEYTRYFTINIDHNIHDDMNDNILLNWSAYMEIEVMVPISISIDGLLNPKNCTKKTLSIASNA